MTERMFISRHSNYFYMDIFDSCFKPKQLLFESSTSAQLLPFIYMCINIFFLSLFSFSITISICELLTVSFPEYRAILRERWKREAKIARDQKETNAPSVISLPPPLHLKIKISSLLAPQEGLRLRPTCSKLQLPPSAQLKVSMSMN